MCDINASLIERWNTDDLPFYEPDLDKYFSRAKHSNKNLSYTTDVKKAITEAHIVIIAVNTPPKKAA